MEDKTRQPHPTVFLEVMTMDHYDSVYELWRNSEGIGVSAADEKDRLPAYLQRNPGMSLVALEDEQVVGAVLCGHDGRRGFLHHLAVRESHRRQGIGRALVARALYRLTQAGIDKCHAFMFGDNLETRKFWQDTGWNLRTELVILSAMTSKEDPIQRT